MDINHTFPWFHRVFVIFVVVVVVVCILFCGGARQYSVLSQVWTHQPSDRNGRSWKTCFTSAKGSNLDPMEVIPLDQGAVDHSERRKVCLVMSKAFFPHGTVFPHGTPFGKSSPQLYKVFVCNRNDFRHLSYVILSLINCLPTYAQVTLNSNLLVTWGIHCYRHYWALSVVDRVVLYIYIYLCVCVIWINVFIIVDCHYDIRFREQRWYMIIGECIPEISGVTISLLWSQPSHFWRPHKPMAFLNHLRTFMHVEVLWSSQLGFHHIWIYLMHVGLALIMLRPKSHSYEPKLGNGTAMAVGPVGGSASTCCGRFGDVIGYLWKELNKYTLWLFNIAMENCPFIDDFPS